MKRLLILATHPIQYFIPLYHRLGATPQVRVKVVFCSRAGHVEYMDEQLGQSFRWDTINLDGLDHKFLVDWRNNYPNQSGFFSLINPGIVTEIIAGHYDAIWVNGHTPLTMLMAILASKTVGTPVFMRSESHFLKEQTRVKRRLRGLLLRFFYRVFCSRFLAIGTLNEEYYKAHGVPEAKIFFTPYCVDNDHFLTGANQSEAQAIFNRANIGLPTNMPLIAYSAKLIERKRPLDLLNAYALVRERGHRAGLVFIGSGELESVLREHVVQQNLPDVHFLGFRNQSELPMLYGLMDVFVLPSRSEAWGLVVNEAMCAGLPIVASNRVGSVVDLVKEDCNGFLFAPGDIELLAGHLERLVVDRALREKMGAASLGLIQSWDFDHCVDGIVQALGSL